MLSRDEKSTVSSAPRESPEISKQAISNNLDLLRAIAVLCVFVSHLLGAGGFLEFGSLGRFGVVIFFVHTSFVLMASLHRLELASKSKFLLMGAFWLRRAFRIYPLAILFVALAATFRIPRMPGLTYEWIGVRGLLANFGLFENLVYKPDILGPLWSLPLEVQMYGMLPFIYLIIRRSTGYRSIILWALSVGVGLIVPGISGRLNVFLYAPCFVSGVVAFDVYRRDGRGSQKLPWWLWPIAIVAAILLFGPMDNVSLPEKIYRAWFLSLFLGLAYVNVADAPCNVIQRGFHWIAEHSYGIYLSHIVLIWFVFYPMAASPLWARTLVVACSAVAVPSLLFRFIEQPLILVGHQISRSLIAHKQRNQLAS
jgi:peptidoglycan/LPS O-acetylase OafA/YrhL